MVAWKRGCAVLAIAAASLGGCTVNDVGEARRAVLVDPGVDPGDDPRRVVLPDAGRQTPVGAQSLGAFPRERAFVDAGRDAECHDACPARCGEDEICCWSNNTCVPIDCWECCPSNDPGRDLGHAAGEPP